MLVGAADRRAATRCRHPEPAASAAPRATLRPLAALLVACTVIGLVGWLIQVAADAAGSAPAARPPIALIEETAYGVEHGVHLTALAGGARFRADSNGALGLPFPVERANDLPGDDGAFRIFAYHDVLPAYVCCPRSCPARASRRSPRSTPGSPPPGRSRPRHCDGRGAGAPSPARRGRWR